MAKRIEQKIVTSAANERLISAAKADIKALMESYGNTENGFDEEKVELMRDEYGVNIISQHKKDSLFKRLIEAFVNPFTVVLFLLAAISAFTDIVFASEKDFTAVVIVISMITISGILRFVQETRSNNASEQLKAMINTTTSVMRDGQRIEIPLDEVVVGDIVNLAAGDMIPADVRIISSKDLFVSQSSLTGESDPVEKTGAALQFNHNSPLELNNLAFMGSNVVSGGASCITVAIGDDTFFGAIAQTLQQDKKVVTSFEKGVNSVSWVLIRFMMIMVPIVFFVNGIRKHDWLEALMFGLSVAVGLTPEMLPMIVTTGLAKGAVKMAKKKTIVKNLNAIQNFGAMDVLCTDKTGTLTQDKIVLEKYLDIHGNSDMRILRHAFLNSYFQTGLKNLMDVAIINHATDGLLAELVKKYTKVDEIPFDFTRRRMSVVIKDTNGKTQLITKGAVEEMLSICKFAEYKGEIMLLSERIRYEILSTVDDLNNEGMRVLAIAQKNSPSPEGVFSIADESDMVLIGYLAFLDPPKESSAKALKALKEFGVNVKVLTGDNATVAQYICRQVGIKITKLLLGGEIEEMSDRELAEEVEEANIFAKLTPAQKVRLVKALKANGHVVGFMGDGINDAAAIGEADVGISVDTAVDIAKESADVILLEKDLMVLERGVIEGRKTFANIIKYIKMTASSNFGNMFSVLAASAFLPFLPMMPLQILVLNLIYDISCISVPWDNVDTEYIRAPRNWDAKSISKFMLWIGPTSSVFDITTYLLMFYLICPWALGGAYHTLSANDQAAFIALFNTGWFVESLWSQTLVIHMIRTKRLPFIHSRASKYVLGTTTAAIAIGTVIPFTALGEGLKMASLPWEYFPFLLATILAYMALVTLIKKIYVRRYGELL